MRPGDSEEPPGESKRQAERAGQTLPRNKVNAAALSNCPSLEDIRRAAVLHLLRVVQDELPKP
jgi:hypothetical protein